MFLQCPCGLLGQQNVVLACLLQCSVLEWIEVEKEENKKEGKIGGRGGGGERKRDKEKVKKKGKGGRK